MPNTCLVSRLTPAGRGAVATVALSGSESVQRIDRRFSAASGRAMAAFPCDRIVFGRWITDDGPGEELVVCRRSDRIEIHCHGGLAASQVVLDSLVADGATEVAWQEMARQLTTDRIAAEALEAAAKARTELTAALLLGQWRGALRTELIAITERLEHDEVHEAIDRVQKLLQRSRIGLRLTDGFRVVLAGPPNVGKSSLINALLGYERSIVFDQPGTTRDVITAHTAINGWPMELADTAGLRSSTDPIEAAGVQRARQRIDQADLVLLIFDAGQLAVGELPSLRKEWPDAIFVENKTDLIDSEAKHRQADVATSAATGEGIDELVRILIDRLVGEVFSSETPIPFRSRQVAEIEHVANAIERGDVKEAIKLIAAI